MNQTSQLRGVTLPSPRYWTGPLSKELLEVRGYKTLQTFFPTLRKLFRLGKWNTTDEIWMDTCWRIQSIDCSGTSGPCRVSLQKNSDLSGAIIRPAFLKVAHLLDPIQWIRGDYSLPKEPGLPYHHKNWAKTLQKLQDPGNQAYIDTICSYAVGRLREEDVSPHFNLFYGAFCARASTYRYNLTDDFQSYRHEGWLWRGLKRGLFKFKIVNNLNPKDPIPESVLREFLEETNSVQSENLGEIEIDNSDRGSIHSETLSFDSAKSSSDSEDSESESDEEDPEHSIYVEIENYPVILIITEQNTDTMDMLFEDYDEVGAEPGTDEWTLRWTAWIFQIVAALAVAQSILGLTHNDLHSNNIVWSPTEEPYLYYKLRSGTTYRVPTFGKVFRIIDYGRSIFRINGQRFISDDFKKGNDADGQYVFQPLTQKFAKEIPPNPSFDLARLTVSIIDGIFPKKPLPAGTTVLSKEPGLTVMETVSPLYNLLWKWMIDDSGRTIFINPDGTERFPDFDLYKHIAEFVHGAIPSQQFGEVFRQFETEYSGKTYSLFC
jgi:hypothetical protein